MKSCGRIHYLKGGVDPIHAELALYFIVLLYLNRSPDFVRICSSLSAWLRFGENGN
jgi:hypothetical protein